MNALPERIYIQRRVPKGVSGTWWETRDPDPINGKPDVEYIHPDILEQEMREAFEAGQHSIDCYGEPVSGWDEFIAWKRGNKS